MKHLWVALFLVASFALVSGVSAATVSLENGQVASVGQTDTMALRLDQAPDGLNGYIIVITIADPSKAEITGVTYPAWTILNQTSTLPADVVTLTAAGQVGAGSTNIDLATLTVRGDQLGSTAVTISVTAMDDAVGDPINPTVQPGTFTVGTGPAPPVPYFIAYPTAGNSPLAVQFNDYSTGTGPFTYQWNFGDGSANSTLKNPAHTYTSGVTTSYPVTLTVTNAAGSATLRVADFITVYSSPAGSGAVVIDSLSPSVGITGDTVAAEIRGSGFTAGPRVFLNGTGFADINATSIVVHSSDRITCTFSLLTAPAGTRNLVVDYTQIVPEKSAVLENAFEVVAVQHFTIALKHGWNFISVPRTLATGFNTAGVVFANVNKNHHSIFMYDAEAHEWVQIQAGTVLKPLDGFWIWSETAMNVPLIFGSTGLSAPPAKQLYTGWNSIGYSDLTASTTRDTLVSVNEQWSQAMGYDATNQRYETQIINGGSGSHSDQTLMHPSKGYWVFMREPGVLAGMSA